jgi:hypothetical protein
MFPPNQRSESYALNVHFSGLSHLYAFVKAEEGRMLTEHPGLGFFAPFSDRGDVIPNHFIWYSNSFVPFIDFFSRAHALPKRKLRREFLPVKMWRNKIGAHFSLVNPGSKRALTCPACGFLIKTERKGDSAMVQKASVNQYLTWTDGRFSVGREVMRSVDTGDSTPDNWGWEITEVHERVVPILKRYV